MSGMFSEAVRPALDRIGWMVLHSVWQIALVAVLLHVALLCLRRASSQIRYLVSCLALVLMVVVPGVGFALFYENEGAVPQAEQQPLFVESDGSATVRGSSMVPEEGERLREAAAVTGDPIPARPPVVSRGAGPLQSPLEPTSAPVRVNSEWSAVRTVAWCWVLGALAFLFRPMLALVVVERLRRCGTSAVPPRVAGLARQYGEALGLRQHIEVLQSTLAEVPCTVGHFRPVILLPVSVLSGCSPTVIELVLAHELAHIRRSDFLISGLQTVIETVLFFHPLMWWGSARVREEREMCCDADAVSVCGEPAAYMEALLAVEAIAARPAFGVLAASGGSIATRIRRIAGQPAHPGSPAVLCAALMTLIAMAGLVSGAPPNERDGVQVGTEQPAGEEGRFADSVLPSESDRGQDAENFERLTVRVTQSMMGAKETVSIEADGRFAFEASYRSGPLRYSHNGQLPDKELTTLDELMAEPERLKSPEQGRRFVADATNLEIVLTTAAGERTFLLQRGYEPDSAKLFVAMIDRIIRRERKVVMPAPGAQADFDRIVLRRFAPGGRRESLTIYPTAVTEYDLALADPGLRKHSHRDRVSARQLKELEEAVASAALNRGIARRRPERDALEWREVLVIREGRRTGATWSGASVPAEAKELNKQLEQLRAHASGLVGDVVPRPVAVTAPEGFQIWQLRVATEGLSDGSRAVLTLYHDGHYTFELDPATRGGYQYVTRFRVFPKSVRRLDDFVIAYGYRLPQVSTNPEVGGARHRMNFQYTTNKTEATVYAREVPVQYTGVMRIIEAIHTQESLLYRIAQPLGNHTAGIERITAKLNEALAVDHRGKREPLPLDFERFVPRLTELSKSTDLATAAAAQWALGLIATLPADYMGRPDPTRRIPR